MGGNIVSGVGTVKVCAIEFGSVPRIRELIFIFLLKVGTSRGVLVVYF